MISLLFGKVQTHTKKSSQMRALIGWGGRTRTSEMPGPKPGALPLGDAPSGKYYHTI